MIPMEVTGNVRNRFIQAAVLLRMLDPVRGEATVHGLDRDSSEMITSRERLLKRKFLDSFALICAIKKNGESTSAACMEEGAPQGTIIRIASNAGVGENTLGEVRQLVAVLNSINNRVQSRSQVEADILIKIVRLDIAKIRHYIEDLCAAKGVFDEPVSAIEARIRESSNSTPALQDFLEWFRHIFAIRDLSLNPEAESLVECVKWAQNARAYYFDHLQAAFSTIHSLPRWVRAIFKLGRYSIAAKALVKFAFEFPDLLNPMIVEPVIAPSKTPFTVPEGEVPLTCVLRRVVGCHASEYLPRLARVWNTPDAETYFQRACPQNLIVHAEIQLVNFYDHNRQCRPSFRFIGLYLPWIPPPATDSTIYRRYKIITNELSKLMEAAAKNDLENRLGEKRRSIPADSTAGVSLSGLTDAVRTGSQNILQSQTNVQISSDTAIEVCGEGNIREGETTRSPSSSHIIDVVELTPTDVYVELVGRDRGEAATVTEKVIENPNPTSILAMVFHFMRADDFDKQDIVSMRDILDLSTNRPSWAKLLEILRVDDGFGIAFREGQQMLIVNDRIRVSNERQFLACLQHLLNSNVLNSEALVCNI